MTDATLEDAIRSTQEVLAGVTSSQLVEPTPCAQWTVDALINHIVGGQYYFASAIRGEPIDGDAPDFSSGNFVTSFDDGSTRCLEAFRAPGAMEQMVTLPFGTMPGSTFLGLASMDTFVHGWDLARATGQSSDLNPTLATELLTQARGSIPDAMRNSEGNPFGPATSPPAGASAADELAAFLGRQI